VGGNAFMYPQCDANDEPKLGTTVPLALQVITDGQTRMVVAAGGRVGIGVIPSSAAVGNYRLFVENGIACRDVLVKLGAWPDYVFQPNYALMPLDELRQFLTSNGHLPGIPSAADLEEQQGVEVGNLQTRMLKVVEEQALYILQLQQKQTELEARLKTLESAPH
jgi:hypothetical protein